MINKNFNLSIELLLRINAIRTLIVTRLAPRPIRDFYPDFENLFPNDCDLCRRDKSIDFTSGPCSLEAIREKSKEFLALIEAELESLKHRPNVDVILNKLKLELIAVESLCT